MAKTHDIKPQLIQEMKNYYGALARVAKWHGKPFEEIVDALPQQCPKEERQSILTDLKGLVKYSGGLGTLSLTRSVAGYFSSKQFKQPACTPGIRQGDDQYFQFEEGFVKLQLEKETLFSQYQITDLPSQPFLDYYKTSMPLRHIDTLRSMAVFHQLPNIFQEEYPSLLEDRKLTVVYPASGKRLGPLYIAFLLMDQNKIDSAQYTYTEVNPMYMSLIHDQLTRLQDAKIIDQYQALVTEFAKEEGGGVEVHFTFSYKGKAIELIFALERSEKEFWRKEYVADADLIIFDDSGGECSNPDYLKKLAQQKKENNNQKLQLVLTEGRSTNQLNEFSSLTCLDFYKQLPSKISYRVPPNFTYKEIQGSYGHALVEGLPLGKISVETYVPKNTSALLVKIPDIK